MTSFRMEEAAQARRELAERLTTLGAAVTENVKHTASYVIEDTMNDAEARVKSALVEFSPRRIIRENPLASLAGAFLTGMVLAAQRSSRRMAPSHPVLATVTALGLDLLRAYALSQIDRAAAPHNSPTSGLPS